MRTFVVMLATAAAVAASGCGATARTTTVQTRAFPALTSATTTFTRSITQDADLCTYRSAAPEQREWAPKCTPSAHSSPSRLDSPFAFTISGPFTTTTSTRAKWRCGSRLTVMTTHVRSPHATAFQRRDDA